MTLCDEYEVLPRASSGRVDSEAPEGVSFDAASIGSILYKSTGDDVDFDCSIDKLRGASLYCLGQDGFEDDVSWLDYLADTMLWLR